MCRREREPCFASEDGKRAERSNKMTVTAAVRTTKKEDDLPERMSWAG